MAEVPKSLPPEPAKVGDVNISPTTTAAHDLETAGQRRVNILWEITQAIIAIIVVTGTLAVAALLVVKGDAQAPVAFLLLSNAFFMIGTFYFQRTNHTKVGGVQPDKARRGE